MSVYKKRNRWYIDYYLPDGTRKREAVSIKGKAPERVTREDAKKAIAIRRAEIAQGKFELVGTIKPLVFDRLLDRYLEWAKDNHRAPARDSQVAKLLKDFFRGRPITSITPWLIEKYKSHRKAIGRKPETINRELGILKRMFNLAIQWKIATTNPVKGVTFLQTQKYIPRVLKEWEFHKLYQAASPHLKPILLCAYTTGMRKGEILKLKWKDVDLEQGYIFVKETKNNESRALPIDETLKETLIQLNEESICEHIFTTHEGEPYTYKDAFKRAWTTALKRSRIAKCRFHDLRHTFCSDLIVGEKEDIATVMELTGHKDIRMLQRYSHTREEAKKAAITKLGKRLKHLSMDTSMDTSETKSAIEPSP